MSQAHFKFTFYSLKKRGKKFEPLFSYLNDLIFQGQTVTRRPAVSLLWNVQWLPGGGHEAKWWYLWTHSRATHVSNTTLCVFAFSGFLAVTKSLQPCLLLCEGHYKVLGWIEVVMSDDQNSMLVPHLMPDRCWYLGGFRLGGFSVFQMSYVILT